jgi:hypothetical protein
METQNNLEPDFKERVEKFDKEFREILGKYEIGLMPVPQFVQNEKGRFEVVGSIMPISTRKPPTQFIPKVGNKVINPEE